MTPPDVQVIVITGSMGSGKTTMMAEASDILATCGLDHAAIDLDALGIACVPGHDADLTYRNLETVWTNCAVAGARRLLIAAAVESRAELDRIRAAVPGAHLVVCRLTASLDTMQQRVAVREPGMFRDRFVARVEELERLLDTAALEDFTMMNEARSVTETARAILRRAGWI